jgi:hypothetical protein
MRLDLLSDSNWEAKIAHAIRPLSLKSYFEGRCYGSGLAGLAIVLMSRDPAHAFRRRVRFERQTRILYTDVMLDLAEMRRPGHVERRALIARRLFEDIPPTIAKYRLPDFDLNEFSKDFRAIVEKQLLGPDSTQYDHLCLP